MRNGSGAGGRGSGRLLAGLAGLLLAWAAAPAQAGSALRTGATLGFVVDHTGSMTAEIDAVRASVAQIAAAAAGGAGAPVDYLLQLFADPQVATPFVTDDPDALLAATQAIQVTSGGDCPEPSQAALLSAIGAARRGSELYVYTDADAKDAQLGPLVSLAAVAKGISVNFVLTDTCASNPDPVYVATARETGGRIFLLGEDEVDALFAIFEPGLAGDLQPILIADTDLDFGVPRTWPVIVDGTVSSLTFVATLEALTSVTVRRPGGAVVQETDADATVTSLSTGAIVTVDAPATGTWELEVLGNGLAFVSASGNSPLAFVEFAFVEAGPGGLVPIPGLPVTGGPSTYVAQIVGPLQSAALEARDVEAAFLQALPSDPDDPEAGPDEWVGSSALPAGTFRTYATGLDSLALPWQRAFAPAVRAQSVLVEPPAAPILLEAATQTDAVFQVTNFGASGGFVFTAADEQGLVVDVQPASATLATGVPTDVTVTLSALGGAQPGDDALTVVAQSQSDPQVRNFAQADVGVEAGAACSPAPRLDCLVSTVSGKSKLSMKPSRGKLSFTWKKGEETPLSALGDPVVDTDYAFCLYRTEGGIPTREVEEVVVAGAGWKAKKSGFAWKAGKGAIGPVKLTLKAAAFGKSKVALKGKELALPALPLEADETFVGQLAAGTGTCWTATFPMPARGNQADKFKGRSE